MTAPYILYVAIPLPLLAADRTPIAQPIAMGRDLAVAWILEIPISQSLQLSTIVCRDLAVAWILGIPMSQSLQLSTILCRDLAMAWILGIPISQSLQLSTIVC